MKTTTNASMITSVECEETSHADKDIPVYSPFATNEVLTPDHAKAIYRETCTNQSFPRESYLPLPWPMDELIGTIWRNVHTGDPTEVIAIQQDHWLNPQLYIQSSHAWGIGILWTLGLWTKDRWGGHYVIEHWVRVDHLPASEQLPWFHCCLDCIKVRIASSREQLAKYSRMGDNVNRRLQEQNVARDCRELAYARSQLRAFEECALLAPIHTIERK